MKRMASVTVSYEPLPAAVEDDAARVADVVQRMRFQQHEIREHAGAGSA
jgi:hypothetical protein